VRMSDSGSRAGGRTEGEPGSTWMRPPPRGKRDVVIGTRINTAVPVGGGGDEGCSLGAYMMLPPEQYVLIPLPNKAKLDRIDSGNFRLRVPELQFLNVWVRPMCEASVDVTPNGVVINVTKCHLEGSPEVERLGINKRYELQMRVVLSAREDTRGLKSVMVGRSDLSVWVDPPSIFRAMFPKRLMESTGNAVLRSSLNRLQETFLKGLAQDFELWASDASYRATRANAGEAKQPPQAAAAAKTTLSSQASGKEATPSKSPSSASSSSSSSKMSSEGAHAPQGSAVGSGKVSDAAADQKVTDKVANKVGDK